MEIQFFGLLTEACDIFLSRDREFGWHQATDWAFQVAQAVKNQPANARDLRDTSSIPGSGRSPGEEHGTPSILAWKNPMDRGA